MTSRAIKQASNPRAPLVALVALVALGWPWGCGSRPLVGGGDGGGGDGGTRMDVGVAADVGARTEWSGVRWRGGTFTVCGEGGAANRDVRLEIPEGVDPTMKEPFRCHGVYHRYRGTLDESGPEPVLHVTEVLEARWCRPGDCGLDCVPDKGSCFEERMIPQDLTCTPVDPNDAAYQAGYACQPIAFYGTEDWGWMGYARVERGTDSETCVYGTSFGATVGSDSCKPGTRCVTGPDPILPGEVGSCAAYCDPAGVEGEPCVDGECIPCRDLDWGLCFPKSWGTYDCWKAGTCDPNFAGHC